MFGVSRMKREVKDDDVGVAQNGTLLLVAGTLALRVMVIG